MATIGLTAFKLVVAYLSGSVGVLSEGIHSALDLVSAAVSFFTVREAVKPADADHPFGHGKIETLSSLFEAILLVAAAMMIVFEGVDHLMHPRPLEYEGLAMGVILFSLVASYLVYLHNRRAAEATESSALHVNALHFLSDVVASAGVLLGLVLLKLTGWQPIDPIVAFLVAGYIFVISLKQVKGALDELSDAQIPEFEIKRVREVLDSFQGKTLEAHDLRTRKSGVQRHLDFHLVVCGYMSVNESHEVCDQIESKIQEILPTASVSIHVEPCGEIKPDCHVNCPIYQARKK